MVGNADSGEDALTVGGHEDDDKNLTLWDNADTIVVVHSVGPVILKTWIEGANVTAILRVWTGLPRQET